MEIFGIGTDIIEVSRIRSAIEKNNGFRLKVYTQNEIDYCEKKDKGRYPSYAARFAAKEAVAKALAEGVGKNVSLNEIELANLNSGAPYIKLYGGTSKYSKKLKISEIRISVSATQNFAVAFAIAVK